MKLFIAFGIIPFGVYLLYIKSMSRLTRYYPFSLLHQDCTFHYRWHKHMHILFVIEKNLSIEKLPHSAWEVDDDQYYYYLTVDFKDQSPPDVSEKIKQRIEKAINLDDNDLIIHREPNNQLKFLVPKNNPSLS